MPGRDDDRGVSEVIGFILVFSFVVIAFTVYQGIVVPDQNRVAEFEHNQMVQGQLQDLRNAIMSAATGGTERTVSINLGAEYPRRALARNLGYSGGAVATGPPDGASEISVANATAVDRFGETSDYWNGTTHRFSTTTLIYQPVYSHYSNAPLTIYENTLSYNRFGNGVNLSITGESLVDGKRITLVSLVGNISESGTDTITVDPDAISASTERISIRNETDPVNLTIPTRLDASWWNETLSRENVSQGGHVTSVKDTGENQVTILLQPGVTYTLRMAKIGVGSSERDEPVEYLTLAERPSETVFNDTSHSITVQARDRFNNPASGARVNASVYEGDGRFSETEITTSTDGEATFNYSANTSGTDKLRFNITPESGGQPPYEVVWVNLSVKSSSGGGGGGGGGGTSVVNPSSNQSTLVYVRSQNAANNQFDVVFNATGGSDVTIDEARFQFHLSFSSTGGGGGGVVGGLREPASGLEIGMSDRMTYQGDMASVGETIDSGGEQILAFTLYDDGGGVYNIEDGGFMVITVRTASDETLTFYITVPES